MDRIVAPDLENVDLSNPDLYRRGEQHAVWRLLRDRAPVFWNRQRRGPGFWAITRHEDVRRISRDARTFISSGGTSTQDLERGETASMDYRIMQGTLVIIDPPRHTKLRALVNKAFTPQAVARLEPYVREVVGKVLDEAATRGACDFVSDVAARLPYSIICEMLGIPGADRRALFEAIRPMMSSPVDLAAGEATNPMAAALGLIDYLTRLVEERAYEPRDDMISSLVCAEVEGERLSRPDTLAMCILLFIAGSETTMNAIAGGMLALLEHPEERSRLRADAGLMPAAVEEILRWTSPTMVSMVRTATRDAEVRGTRIKSGDKVTLWYGAANRDEDVFTGPERFDAARAPNDHVAFGLGEHFCLGAGLARLEIRVTFEELLARHPAPALAGEPVRLRSNIFNGLEQLPVRLG